MPKYRVGVWFDECVEITIKADTVEEAEKLAHGLVDEMGGTDYPKEYSPVGVYVEWGLQVLKEWEEV